MICVLQVVAQSLAISLFCLVVFVVISAIAKLQLLRSFCSGGIVIFFQKFLKTRKSWPFPNLKAIFFVTIVILVKNVYCCWDGRGCETHIDQESLMKCILLPTV
jgi:hypothetical protein